MKKLLKNLWHGKLCPEENIGRDEEYRRLHQSLYRAEKELKLLLNEEQIKCLEAYQGIDMTLSELEDEIVFAKGFRLGVRLLLEALREES